MDYIKYLPKSFFVFFLIIVILSCSNDDKAIDFVTENIERGAVLRNINKISKDFIHNDFESAFEIEVEEQDLEEGDLLDFVRMYIAYVDRDSNNGDNSALEISFKDIPRSSFNIGPNGLPRSIITLAYQEAIDVLSLNSGLISPGDQFKLRLEIHLIDGRTFSNENNSASILTDACFFKSPLRYEINVLEPISDELFTGTYAYEVISDNVVPRLDVNEQGVVSIQAGNLPNVRTTGIIGEGIEFTIAGEYIYPKIYQSVNLLCLESGPHILSGPNDQNFGLLGLTDDTVFDIDIDIGFEGWDGTLSNGNQSIGIATLYKIRFSKQ